MALVQHWKCQDNAASTTVVATVGTNATLAGGNNTADLAIAGPGTALTSAFDLDGTNDYIDVSAASISFATSTAFTFAGWIYPDTLTGGASLIGNAAGANSNIRFFNSTTVRITNSATNTTDFTVDTVTTGEWHHVVVTRTSGNSARVFVDGVESSTGAASRTGTFAPDAFGIRNGTELNGRICDCRVYDSDESANVATIMAEKDSAASGKSYYNSLMQQLVS